MKTIRKILVCVDLSDYSRDTVEYAISFRKGFGAEILLLNIINKRDIETVRTANSYYPDKIDINSYVARVREEREKKLKTLTSEYAPHDIGHVVTKVGSGVPFEEILSAIEQEGVDLVIMGNKGRSNLASTLFGSTAEKVFKYADVPVVSIRSKLLSGSV